MCTEKSIEELILNTKELDFAKSYHEKQMKIVNAVNGLEARTVVISNWVCEFATGLYYFDLEFSHEVICSTDEYNQCIEEMKYHYDIPRWCSYNRADKEPLTVENSDYSFYEEKFVYGQDVYVNNTVYSNKKFKFGCFTLDGNKALLFYVNGDAYCRVTVESISSNPIKSKEDIELEEAKRKQVYDNVNIYSHYFESAKKATDVFEHMQEYGHLSEIILPLEKS